MDKNDSALLIIDLQTEFYAQHRRDVNRAQLAKVRDNIAWLAGVARALGLPTIVTEEDPQQNGPTEPKILAEVAAGSSVLPKISFGAAWQTDIREAIEATQRGTIVVVGAETDVCVTHSVIGLLEQDYRVVVISDAVYSPGEAHENGLRRLAAGGVEIMSAKQALYDWLPLLAQIRDFQDENPVLAQPRHFSM